MRQFVPRDAAKNPRQFRVAQLVRPLLRTMRKFADRHVAHLAAIAPVPKISKAHAPEEDAPAADGTFAAVLAVVTPQTPQPKAPEPAPKVAISEEKPAVANDVPQPVEKPAPVPVVAAKPELKSAPKPALAVVPQAEHEEPEPAPVRAASPEHRTHVAPKQQQPAQAVKVAQPVLEKIIAAAKTDAPVSQIVLPKPQIKAEAPKPKPEAKAAVAAAKAAITVIDHAAPRPEPEPEPGTAPAPNNASDKPAPKPEIASVRAEPEPKHEPATHEAPKAQTGQPPASAPNAPQQPTAVTAAPQPAHVATVSAPHLATNIPHTPETVPEAPAPDVTALAAAIAKKSAQGSKTFEIRLDPPELGRVEVHLSVAHDGKAEATLYADRPETVALLQRDSQNLERALRDAGLDVSNSSLNFSLKGEQRQGDGGGASKALGRSLPDAVVARSEAVNASLAQAYPATGDGARLDIRV